MRCSNKSDRWIDQKIGTSEVFFQDFLSLFDGGWLDCRLDSHGSLINMCHWFLEICISNFCILYSLI